MKQLILIPYCRALALYCSIKLDKKEADKNAEGVAEKPTQL